MLENHEEQPEGPVEIAIVGDMTEHGAELTDKLLSVPQGGECIIYFDSPGGSPYCALSLMTLIVMRELHATGIVSGECSSAAALAAGSMLSPNCHTLQCAPVSSYAVAK